MVAQIDPLYRRAGLGPTWVRLVSWAVFEGRPLTTRGRWINPFVLGLHRLHCRLPRLGRVEAPIFIVGMGRSGTTLLGKLLSLHPEVGFLNEPKALWHVAIGREDIVGSYDRRPARYRLGSADAGWRERRRLGRLFAAYLRWTRRHRLVDKNPEGVFRADFLRAIFPDARFLIAIRDGRAVCRSVERWSERHRRVRRGEVHDWWGVGRRKWRLLVEQVATGEPDFAPLASELLCLEEQQQMAALEWILSSRYAQRCVEAADDALAVRYEDLTAAPLPTLATILDFCHLTQDERIATYCRNGVRDGSPARPLDLPSVLERPFRETLEHWSYES